MNNGSSGLLPSSMLEFGESATDNMGEVRGTESIDTGMVAELDRGDEIEYINPGPSTSNIDRGDNYTDEQIDAIVEKERQEMVSKIVRRFNHLPSEGSRYYISDVIPTNNTIEHHQLLGLLKLRAGEYRGAFFLVSSHGDHIHVIHDCAFSNRSCRCSWKKDFQTQARLRGRIRKAIQLGTIDQEGWQKIILYFTSGGRHCKIFVLGGRVQRLPNGIENMEPRRRNKRGTSELMEICSGENYPELQQTFSNISSIGKGKRARNDLNEKERGTRKQRISDKIEQLILDHPVCPLISICDIDEYLADDDLKYIRSDNIILKDVVDYMAKKFCRYSLHDFNVFYKRPNCTPYFSAGYRDVDDKYMNIEDTKSIINRLLMYQCNEDTEQVKAFLLALYNIIERNIPKTNTFLLYGPPSSGKNFFIDMILAYVLNTGQFGIANRHNGFSFQDGHGKRIILWDEPNYASDMLELMKMILGGGDCKVRVKQKHDTPLCRTPVIILTNNRLNIMHDIAFKDRILQFSWNAAPFLKECEKLPHPLYTFEMFIDYNIITV